MNWSATGHAPGVDLSCNHVTLSLQICNNFYSHKPQPSVIRFTSVVKLRKCMAMQFLYTQKILVSVPNSLSQGNAYSGLSRRNLVAQL